MMRFELDSRLEKDSIPVGRLDLCEVRLLNDARWPWLVLIPMKHGLCEIHDLDDDERIKLAWETGHASSCLITMTNADKINTGALGNIVRQLHIHVIARNIGDDNWPGPVWGHGNSQVYARVAADDFIARIQRELNVKIL